MLAILLLCLLSLAHVACGADTHVNIYADSVRGGKTYSTGPNQDEPSDANGNTDSIFIDGGDTLIVSGLSKPYDSTGVSWEVIDRYMFDNEGWSDSFTVCAYHNSVCYSRDSCETKGDGTSCTGSSCSKSIFDMPVSEWGCKKEYDIYATGSGWGGDFGTTLKIKCNDSSGCRFMVFVRLWEVISPPPPPPPPPPPLPPPPLAPPPPPPCTPPPPSTSAAPLHRDVFLLMAALLAMGFRV